MTDEISSQDLQKLIKENPKDLEIIDVRSQDEYDLIHIIGSKLLPFDGIMDNLEEIDWTKKIVFVCRSGERSKLVASRLLYRGEWLKNLSGGLIDCYNNKEFEFLEISGKKSELKRYFM